MDGKYESSWDNYLNQLEERNINKRLEETKKIIQDREYILKKTEEQLRASKNTDDQVYVYRFLEKKKVYQITGLVNYSERHVKNFLFRIKENIKRIKK